MMYTFAGTMAVFMDDEWRINEILMGFKHLNVDDHKGKHAAKAFMQTVVPFSAAKKMSCFLQINSGLLMYHYLYILALVMDNALPNNVLAHTLVDLLKQRYGLELDVDHLQGRCIAHIINLVVQALLHGMDDAFDDPDVLDYFTLDPDAPLNYTADDDPELQCMEGAEAVAADAAAMLMAIEDEDDLPSDSPLRKVGFVLSITFASC
jgi:hypothetical protein